MPTKTRLSTSSRVAVENNSSPASDVGSSGCICSAPMSRSRPCRAIAQAGRSHSVSKRFKLLLQLAPLKRHPCSKCSKCSERNQGRKTQQPCASSATQTASLAPATNVKPLRRRAGRGRRKGIPPVSCGGRCCYNCGKRGNLMRDCKEAGKCYFVFDDPLACDDETQQKSD